VAAADTGAAASAAGLRRNPAAGAASRRTRPRRTCPGTWSPDVAAADGPGSGLR